MILDLKLRAFLSIVKALPTSAGAKAACQNVHFQETPEPEPY